MNDAAAIVARARAGDHRAFTDLVRGCDDRMRRLAIRLLGSRGAMDDALQDAYVKAYRAIDTFEGGSQFATWLSRIVYRTCVDHLRAASRREALGGELEPLSRDQPDHADRVASHDELHRAVAALPADQAAAIVLVDLDGLTYAEAALVLDVAEGTVASRLGRARETLRASMADDVAGGSTR